MVTGAPFGGQWTCCALSCRVQIRDFFALRMSSVALFLLSAPSLKPTVRSCRVFGTRALRAAPGRSLEGHRLGERGAADELSGMRKDARNGKSPSCHRPGSCLHPFGPFRQSALRLEIILFAFGRSSSWP